MCDYCDCRSLQPIQDLSDEHERIAAHAHDLTVALDAGDASAAGVALTAIQESLAPHLAREEAGLFARLAAHPGLADYLAELAADHERARAGLLGATGPGDAAALRAGLAELAAHIETEEYDLFPASRLLLDDEEWQAIDALHVATGMRGEAGTATAVATPAVPAGGATAGHGAI